MDLVLFIGFNRFIYLYCVDTILYDTRVLNNIDYSRRISSVVEQLICNLQALGSSPRFGTQERSGSSARLEHPLVKREVAGSIPVHFVSFLFPAYTPCLPSL